MKTLIVRIFTLTAAITLSGCSAHLLSSRLDDRMINQKVTLECSQANLYDVLWEINHLCTESTGITNPIIVSGLSLQQEGETPLITMKMSAPLQEVITNIEHQALVLAEKRDSHIILSPDSSARKDYIQTHAKQWNIASNILAKAIDDLVAAQEISLGGSETRLPLQTITNHNQIVAIASWIRSRTLVYDELESIERSRGTVCGCIPWIIEFGSPKQNIHNHVHSLIINNKEAFRPARENDLGDFRKHLLKIGVLKEKY